MCSNIWIHASRTVIVLRRLFCNTQVDGSEEGVEFECNRWLDVKEDDGLIVREIAAGGSQLLNS